MPGLLSPILGRGGGARHKKGNFPQDCIGSAGTLDTTYIRTHYSFFLPFVPIEVEPTGANDGPGFVHMVHFYHAVEVPEPFIPSARLQTSSWREQFCVNIAGNSKKFWNSWSYGWYRKLQASIWHLTALLPSQCLLINDNVYYFDVRKMIF